MGAGDDAFERRLVRHGDQRFDRPGVEVLAHHQPLVHAPKHVARARHRLFGALDLDAVAARGDIDAEPVFDVDQIGVELSEQGSQDRRLIELHLRPGAVGRCVAKLRHIVGASRFAGHALLSKGPPRP